MMALDAHVHIRDGKVDPAELMQRMHAAGVEGGILLSLPPASMSGARVAAAPAQRLENVLAWCQEFETLHPFYWIDPTESDALQQVTDAVEQGIAGFKVICDHFYPGDPQALRVFHAIAEAGRPILFHSGILWDGKPSSNYCRPANFEALMTVPGLRFALAHISWPWVDECIALYGKIKAAQRRHSEWVSAEMFIDTTPGTPPIYRREALTKLFTVGYDVAHNVIFGSDSVTPGYGDEYVGGWIARDQAILEELGIPAETRQAVFSGNLKRFLGL